jgi:hypothetical protein
VESLKSRLHYVTIYSLDIPSMSSFVISLFPHFTQYRITNESVEWIDRHQTGCNGGDIFNNQPDALIILIYSVTKLYMYRTSSLPIIRSFLLCIRHWNCSSILTLLGSGHQNLHETYQCRMYSRKLLMMGREDARYM